MPNSHLHLTVVGERKATMASLCNKKVLKPNPQIQYYPIEGLIRAVVATSIVQFRRRFNFKKFRKIIPLK